MPEHYHDFRHGNNARRIRWRYPGPLPSSERRRSATHERGTREHEKTEDHHSRRGDR